MHTQIPRKARGAEPRQDRTRRAPRRHGRRLLAAATATVLLLSAVSTSTAATKVTVPNPGGLTAVGPVNAEYGFPSWYGDSAGTRIQPCIDGEDPLCGFLPGDIPDPDAPISFPDNWPAEFFYSLIASSLTLPGGGKANLTLGLEASFANGDPIAGDQVTFARTRVTVIGGPRLSTLTFKHPFGELTIDTDGTGKGRLVQDITPAVGNFSTALSSNFGPFVKWDPAVAPAAPEGYLGDPAVAHAIVGGKNGNNLFSVTGGSITTAVSTDQFTVSGKIASNTGVTGDRAGAGGGYLDVFATSSGTQLQVDGGTGYKTTPMTNDPGSSRHYARIALADGVKPTSVVVRNLGDKPASTATIKLPDVIVTKASYDGTALTVAAKSDHFPLTVAGIGQLDDDQPHSFPLAAPPASVSVASSGGTAVTLGVTVTAGAATEPGLPEVPVTPAGPPVIDNTPDNPSAPPTPAPVVTVAAPSATVPGSGVTLDASATTGATSYAWSLVTMPTGTTISNASTAKPTITLPFFTANAATAPAAAWAPVTVKLVATGTGGVTEQTVTIPVKTDVVVISAARHKIGTELRIDGTSLIDGQAGVRTPPTSIVIWDVTKPATPVKIGTSPVDTLGAWAIRLKPGPSVQVSSVLVQATRGGTASSAVTNR